MTQQETRTLVCDQAVFTSLRTPTGEGYRIVAASCSVRPEERAEITRRSPSHGSLNGSGEQAVGLLAYPLASGRHCVCHSHKGGVEHTGRGGQRVWTRIALLDADAYRVFGCNPVRVFRAVGAACELPEPLPPTLDRVRLDADLPAISTATVGDADAVVGLLDALMSEECSVVTQADGVLGPLELAFEMVPVDARSAIAVSSGIGYSPSRRLRTVLLGSAARDVRHATRGHKVRCRDLEAITSVDDSPIREWLRLVHRRARMQRLGELAKFTARMSGTDPTMLLRVAAMFNDLEQAGSIDDASRRALRCKCQSFVAQSAVERELMNSLMAATEEQAPPGDSDKTACILERQPRSL